MTDDEREMLLEMPAVQELLAEERVALLADIDALKAHMKQATGLEAAVLLTSAGGVDLLPEPTCETCRFWKISDDAIGDCRRFPPRLASTPEQQDLVFATGCITGVFPETQDAWWCGEHQPRRAAP